MEVNWYRKELKEQYILLQRLYKEEKKEEIRQVIINTMKTIEICLSKERIPGEIEILLEKDYLELTKTSYIWPYIRKIASLNNDYKPNFSYDDTRLSKKDIIELLHEFFRNGTNKEIYDLFCKIYKENKKNIHFFTFNELSYSGETIYIEYFKKTYIQVFNSYSFEDMATFAHEFGHAIEFNINFNNNLYKELNVYIEIISIFFELICLEYFSKGEFSKASIITSYSNLDEHLRSSKSIANEFILLEAIKIEDFENKNKLRMNINDLVSKLTQSDINNIVNIYPSRDYIYVFAFLVASNLFMIYKKDLDKALYLVKKIINLSCNITSEEYFNKLKEMNLLNSCRTKEYKELIHKRCRTLK